MCNLLVGSARWRAVQLLERARWGCCLAAAGVLLRRRRLHAGLWTQLQRGVCCPTCCRL